MEPKTKKRNQWSCPGISHQTHIRLASKKVTYCNTRTACRSLWPLAEGRPGFGQHVCKTAAHCSVIVMIVMIYVQLWSVNEVMRISAQRCRAFFPGQPCATAPMYSETVLSNAQPALPETQTSTPTLLIFKSSSTWLSPSRHLHIWQENRSKIKYCYIILTHSLCVYMYI